MVNIKQRTLRAFKQNALSFPLHLVQQTPYRCNEGHQRIGNGRQFLEDRIMGDFRLVEAAAQRIVMGQQPVDLGRQGFLVGKIEHANGTATNLVFIGRADAPSRGADLCARV